MRASGKTDRLMTFGKLDIEPGNKGMDIVIAPAAKVEGDLEIEVRSGALVKVKNKNRRGLSNDGLELNGVYERLG